LKLDSWDDKESGQKRQKLKVVAERVQFLGAPRGSAEFKDQAPSGEAPVRAAGRGGRPAAAPAPAPAREAAEPEPTATNEDDNIPF
jgi:single-strand DNA-binding protein